MLTITIEGEEFFDEENQIFLTRGDVVLELEHSLAALSKWESKWLKPFLSDNDKTSEETLDYVRCMCVTPDIAPEIFSKLNQTHIDKISEYLDSKQTATWFSDDGRQSKSREVITTELIYYWMITLGIPLEAEQWHLSRLIALIRVFNAKNSPPKKMSPDEIARRQRELNAKRKAELGTRG